eukprot:SAG31_NODE_831_length_11669_cov_3.410026_14_plen_214_part_00
MAAVTIRAVAFDLAEWTAFTLLTDGQVAMSEVNNLAHFAHKTSHLPSILGIAVHNTAMKAAASLAVSQCNVSVLFSHYTAARTALMLVMASDGDNIPLGGDLSHDRALTVKVLAAKGDWAGAFGTLPDLAAGGATLGDFPTCTVSQIVALQAAIYEPQPDNTCLVGEGAYWLHLDRLLEVTDFEAQVLGRITERELEDVVRLFHASGRCLLTA